MDICCVVDLSSSMGEAAQTADGESPDDGLSVLDVVKHAVRTCAAMLTALDRLSIVVFSNDAKTVLELTPMTEEGHEQVNAALATIFASGKTNLWQGLKNGMQNLNDGDSTRCKALLLLTDGVPNVLPGDDVDGSEALAEAQQLVREMGEDPTQGEGLQMAEAMAQSIKEAKSTRSLSVEGLARHLHELKEYLETAGDFKFQLNTFGFGYDLDSELLSRLAHECHGTFAFVPDVLIVGTAFVSSVANLLSTSVQSATLHISQLNGATFEGDIRGSHNVSETSWGKVIPLGPLRRGTSRTIVATMRIPAGLPTPFLKASVAFDDGCNETISIQGCIQGCVDEGHSTDALVASLRSQVVDCTLRAIEDFRAGREDVALHAIADLGDLIESQTVAFTLTGQHKAQVTALHTDLTGRMAKALTGIERFNRWGKHYLRAIARAHQIETCTNYMDRSLAPYGGPDFLMLRAEGETIFVSLPPPVPTLGTYADDPSSCIHSGYTPQRATSSGSVDMSNYCTGSGGGCFGPASTVIVARSGASCAVPVSAVRAGDSVRTSCGLARIRCVVQIRIEKQPLVLLPGGLQITATHPVYIHGEWYRPGELHSAQPTSTLTDLVYNFVLDEPGSLLLVNGVACVTLGHGLQVDRVRHPFYGSRRVIAALERVDGWADGLVSVECVNDIDGHTCAFRPVRV